MADSNRTHTANGTPAPRSIEVKPSADEVKRARELIAGDVLCELGLLSGELLTFCQRLEDKDAYRLRGMAIRLHQLQDAAFHLMAPDESDEEKLDRVAIQVFGPDFATLDHDATRATLMADRAATNAKRESSHV